MICNILSQQTHFGRSFPAAMLFFCLLSTSPVASAGEVTVINSLSFGAIDLHPSGDTITIDATTGPVFTPAPLPGHSVVTGGGSGLLRVTPSPDTDEHVVIIYPNTSILYNGSHNLYIVEIAENSQYSDTGFDLTQGGPTIDISIGGKVVLQGNERDSGYSGSMNIVLNFF